MEEANLIIGNLAQKIANLSTENTVLMARLEMANKRIEELMKES